MIKHERNDSKCINLCTEQEGQNPDEGHFASLINYAKHARLAPECSINYIDTAEFCTLTRRTTSHMRRVLDLFKTRTRESS